MAEQEMKEISEEQLKQMAAQMRATEYKGLSEEEIQERERQKEVRKIKNIETLEDTLEILEKGSYDKAGVEIKLPLSPEQMKGIDVFLPDDIELLRTEKDKTDASETTPSGYGSSFGCENTDALALAQRKYRDLKANGTSVPKILVLNLASATRPGGQTRKGASAQEEDLCRRTSLLLSLESETAKKYYDYNNARKTRMGSDAVMVSPDVEVIKDASSETLQDPFPISVMSCAAPMVRLGLEGMSQQEYEQMLYQRIQGMLLVAASQGYRHLVLGAFGCGVYGNDAAVVSDLFYRAILNLTYKGVEGIRLFDSIDFAVLCRPEKDYNYREFCRNFLQE
ncbi:MAG: TIGR02452 family protein [Clostridiales bacterium]|nr:TIGR02452 family protein [Clostridiales bacterium]